MRNDWSLFGIEYLRWSLVYGIFEKSSSNGRYIIVNVNGLVLGIE